ncbi:MAG TPA: acyl-ACP thioesterase domain-containing protein [Ilumatobacteraceae bacterium]|nr:acyl-ACP thioesterase domain-containing protein [Ilumatobacteraceae bacterium]
MVGSPAAGRTFTGRRRVRLGDCSPGGRLRLDATARYVQDLSDDDTRDAGLAQMTWVVRRAVIDVARFPTYLDPLEMVTWCSGLGSRWAERRVAITGASGGSMSSATLWVHLDSDSLRPAPMSTVFHQTFAPSTLGRTVSSRLTLGSPPPELQLVPWSVRFADFDVMNHVNNAVALVIVEEALAQHRNLRAPMRIDVEYRSSIDRGTVVNVGGVSTADGDRYDGWVVDAHGNVCIAFRIKLCEST